MAASRLERSSPGWGLRYSNELLRPQPAAREMSLNLPKLLDGALSGVGDFATLVPKSY